MRVMNMTDNIYYIPIMCCGQQMADVYIDGKRVAATCSTCHRVWKPSPPTTAQWEVKWVTVRRDEPKELP
jgi:hypothetical protein